MKNIAKKEYGNKLNVTEDIMKVIEDMKALECDILQQYADYIQICYYVNDAIRIKQSLILISSFHIVSLSKLSQCISHQYQSTGTLKIEAKMYKAKLLRL